MSTYLFLTLGHRTVMVAKPATYQDLKREIRKQFPMLASVFSILILFQPILKDGSILNNLVEVDPSAYSAVHDNAQVFINVAEPITKRYMFPLPDGRNSNIGPTNQMPQTDAMGNRINPSMGGVPLNAQVSIKKPENSTSKYIYPHSEPSPQPERSDGAACASGWAGASERFRRSAKLIPNLKDCKEAVGLEVGQSNCYPDEEEEADSNWGHFQQEEKEPNQGFTEKGWYTGTEDFACRDKQDGDAPLDKHAKTLMAGGASLRQDGKDGGANLNTAGKKIHNTNANAVRTTLSYHIRSPKQSGPPTRVLTPEQDLSSGAWHHKAPQKSLYTVAPPPRSEWGSDDGAQGEARGYPLGPSDYINKSPHASPFGPPNRGWNVPWDDLAISSGRPSYGCCWGCCAASKKEENADQKQAHTASDAYGGSFEAAPTAPDAPAAPYGGGVANQVSQDARHHSRDYGASDWSPPRRPYSSTRWSKQALPQAAQPVPPYSPPAYFAPSCGPLSPAGPGRYTTGSPVAKFQRSTRPANCSTAGQMKSAWANVGNSYQAHVQDENDVPQQHLSGHQNGRGPGEDQDQGQGWGKNAQQEQRDEAEDFWYAPPGNATKTVGAGGGGGAFKQTAWAKYDTKRVADIATQENDAGWQLKPTAWGELQKFGKW